MTAWWLAGTTRSARDARIAAIRYLRQADTERRWYAAMLAYGHQVRCGPPPSASRKTAHARQFATAGYPPPYPQDWEAASTRILADEARYLAEADLYVLTPQMLDVVSTPWPVRRDVRSNAGCGSEPS